MLSIGKLGTGQAKYYLDQAHGRVDVVQSVAGGAEDYYTRSGEARGVWLGRGANELGLVGEVGEEQLRPLLEGIDPRTGEVLRRSTSPVRVAAFDLTFSAPKSVSVLYALGDTESFAPRTTTPPGRRSRTWSATRRACAAAMAGRSCSRPTGSPPRRSVIARRAPATRSCTRMSSSPTSRAARTGSGRRSTVGGSTRTPVRRA